MNAHYKFYDLNLNLNLLCGDHTEEQYSNSNKGRRPTYVQKAVVNKVLSRVFLQFCPVSKCRTRHNCSVSNILRTTETVLICRQFGSRRQHGQDCLRQSCPCRSRRCKLCIIQRIHNNPQQIEQVEFELYNSCYSLVLSTSRHTTLNYG